MSGLWRRLKKWSGVGRLTGPESTFALHPTDEEAEFSLQYRGKVVGTLRLQGGEWTFTYAQDFRSDPELSKLRTITEFPDVDKKYSSSELWPFFLMRIPSLKQTAIHEIVEKEQIDITDEAELLRRFGKRTVANPFELVDMQ